MFNDETSLEQEETMFDEDFDWGEDTDETEAEDSETNAADEQEDDGLTVKYNGKETKVKRDDIPTYVQKGMNYDHVMSELDSMRSGNMYKALKKAADKEGMSPEQYAKFVLDQEDANALTEAEAAVRKEFPNIPNNLIKELAEARAAKKANNAKAEKESAEEKAWAEALVEYPDMTKDSVPNEVLQAVANGKTPLIALKDFEISQLKAARQKEAIESKNQKNKEKSTGSMRGSGGDDGRDAFLKEFLSD